MVSTLFAQNLLALSQLKHKDSFTLCQVLMVLHPKRLKLLDVLMVNSLMLMELLVFNNVVKILWHLQNMDCVFMKTSLIIYQNTLILLQFKLKEEEDRFKANVPKTMETIISSMVTEYVFNLQISMIPHLLHPIPYLTLNLQ